MNQNELITRLCELIDRHHLQHKRDVIVAAVKPSVRILPRPEGEDDGSGLSHLGGLPLLPGPELWPRKGNNPLTLIAQIDLAVMPPVEPLLPREGVLSFFYDVEGMPGGEYADRGSWCVLHLLPKKDWKQIAMPERSGKREPYWPKTPLPRIDVDFALDISIPTPRSIELLPLEIADDDWDRYLDLREELRCVVSDKIDVHRMFGHPDSIQGCMQRTVQFESRNEQLPEGVHSYYEHPRAAELIPGAHDWQLLLQIDSDERLNLMWGDAGRIYYWIHRDDLRHCDFSKAWLFLQCY